MFKVGEKYIVNNEFAKHQGKLITITKVKETSDSLGEKYNLIYYKVFTKGNEEYSFPEESIFSESLKLFKIK